MQRRILVLILAVLLLPACNMPAPKTVAELVKAGDRVEDGIAELLRENLEEPAEKPEGIDQPVSTLTAPVEELSAASSNAAGLKLEFMRQPGTPAAVANFVVPDAGCSWAGVGGQVFDSNGVPVASLVVEVRGTLNGKQVYELGLTGSSPVLGPGGFQIQLADAPADSQNSLTIRLLSLAGEPLSDPFSFDTYADCNRNLILVNLNEVGGKMILPLIFNGYQFPP